MTNGDIRSNLLNTHQGVLLKLPSPILYSNIKSTPNYTISLSYAKHAPKNRPEYDAEKCAKFTNTPSVSYLDVIFVLIYFRTASLFFLMCNKFIFFNLWISSRIIIFKQVNKNINFRIVTQPIRSPFPIRLLDYFLLGNFL